MKVHRVMQGEWGSCLFSCNFCPPFGAHFPLPCSTAMFLQIAKARRDVRRLSLLLVLLREMCRWTFCIHACVVSVIDSLKLWSKKSSFFQKILGPLILISTHFPVFFALFHLPYSGISKKIGHTGIADTKKWPDQAVFPCWSNYHTLAGE